MGLRATLGPMKKLFHLNFPGNYSA